MLEVAVPEVWPGEHAMATRMQSETAISASLQVHLCQGTSTELMCARMHQEIHSMQSGDDILHRTINSWAAVSGNAILIVPGQGSDGAGLMLPNIATARSQYLHSD